MPQGENETVDKRIEKLEKEKLGSNVPLSLSTQVIERNGTRELEVSWSYIDHDQIDHFILEVYNEATKRFEPYDGQLGVVKR